MFKCIEYHYFFSDVQGSGALRYYYYITTRGI